MHFAKFGTAITTTMVIVIVPVLGIEPSLLTCLAL